MQRHLVRVTQYLLCSVSMVLTGLFAVSFSSPGEPLGPRATFGPGLMVLIGLGIDLSKYVFWRSRSAHIAFFTLSLLLVMFSWAASVAFFVTQEAQGIEKVRTESASYHAHRIAIDSLGQEIAAKQVLVDKRLGSRYHDQWDKGEALSREIAVLNAKLAWLVNDSTSVGREEARRKASTSAFFLRLASALHIDADVIAVITYSMLALLIEVSALGMISLSSTCYTEVPVTKNGNTRPCGSDISSQEARLRHAILAGNTPPIARQIIRDYRMRHATVKKILKDLFDEGRLRKQNNIYVLNS